MSERMKERKSDRSAPSLFRSFILSLITLHLVHPAWAVNVAVVQFVGCSVANVQNLNVEV